MSEETAADSSTTTPDAGGQQTSLMDAGAPAVETKPEAPAEVTYDFKAPEGMALDQVALGEWQTVAKEAGLTPEAAQRAVDVAVGMLQRQQEAQAAMVTTWTEQVTADKEIGGDKLQENLAVARKALETFGTPELRDVLNMTGLGNHPEVIRAFYRAGKTISEDVFVPGAARGSEVDMAKRMFPNMN